MPRLKKNCDGKHKCCYCPGETPGYSGASGLWYHMQKCHPDKCTSKRTYKKKRKQQPVGKTKKERKKVNINFSDRDNVDIFDFADNQDYGLEKISEVPLEWLSGPKNIMSESERSIDSKWLDIDTEKVNEGLEQYIDSNTRSRKRLKKTKKKSGGKKKRRKTRRRRKRRKKRRKRN